MKLILAILITAMLCITNTITAQNKTVTATVVNITSNKGTATLKVVKK